MRAATLIERLARLARSGVPAGELNAVQWTSLRFLARANRFSRTPAALAEYLGSTRGTVSQTLKVLERRGLIHKTADDRDKRSVRLDLRGEGEALLSKDALLSLASDIQETNAAQALERDLEASLKAALDRRGMRPFGVCRTCQYFRETKNGETPQPYRCALLDEALSERDAQLICVEQC